MPIDAAFLVRNERGIPQPPIEILRRFAEIDSRIGISYDHCAWRIIETWAEHDPRRERIVSGEMDPAFAYDICGWVPITCSFDEMPAYIERELRVQTPGAFVALRAAAQRWNAQVVDDLTEKAVADTQDDRTGSVGIVAVASGGKNRFEQKQADRQAKRA